MPVTHLIPSRSAASGAAGAVMTMPQRQHPPGNASFAPVNPFRFHLPGGPNDHFFPPTASAAVIKEHILRHHMSEGFSHAPWSMRRLHDHQRRLDGAPTHDAAVPAVHDQRNKSAPHEPRSDARHVLPERKRERDSAGLSVNTRDQAPPHTSSTVAMGQRSSSMDGLTTVNAAQHQATSPSAPMPVAITVAGRVLPPSQLPAAVPPQQPSRRQPPAAAQRGKDGATDTVHVIWDHASGAALDPSVLLATMSQFGRVAQHYDIRKKHCAFFQYESPDVARRAVSSLGPRGSKVAGVAVEAVFSRSAVSENVPSETNDTDAADRPPVTAPSSSVIVATAAQANTPLKHGDSNLVRVISVPHELTKTDVAKRAAPHTPLAAWELPISAPSDDASPAGAAILAALLGGGSAGRSVCLEYASHESALAAARALSASQVHGKLIRAVVV